MSGRDGNSPYRTRQEESAELYSVRTELFNAHYHLGHLLVERAQSKPWRRKARQLAEKVKQLADRLAAVSEDSLFEEDEINGQ